MPLPPILEVFVVWHPHDKRGQIVAEALLRHFHSATFSGLAGGAVEVYERSEGWHRQGGPPRPLSCMQAWPNGLPNAQFTAVIPVIGTYLARAYAEGGEWRRYVDEIAAASEPSMFLVPIWLSSQLTSTEIDSALGAVQGITLQRRASSDCLCRDVSQAIAQTISALSGDADRIEVFISHTKYESIQEQGQGDLLRQQVSNSIQASRLADFFDAHDIQAGTKWAEAISGKAAKCALLMVRTDHYSGREWTQIEVAVAKENDLPIVCLHALQAGEERGSFLMDHVPTVRCDPDNPRRNRNGIEQDRGRSTEALLVAGPISVSREARLRLASRALTGADYCVPLAGYSSGNETERRPDRRPFLGDSSGSTIGTS